MKINNNDSRRFSRHQFFSCVFFRRFSPIKKLLRDKKKHVADGDDCVHFLQGKNDENVWTCACEYDFAYINE